MILLHRITSFALAALTAAGFFILIFYAELTGLAAISMLFLVPLLFARLLQWEIGRVSFWVFLGTPVFYLVSSLFFFLFLEQNAAKLLLGLAVTIGIWLYAENLFAFYHLPSAYQAYALEYLSLAIYVLSAFFFAGGAYGSQLFLQLPVWVPALAIFWTVLFATAGVFWVSKVDHETGNIFAFVGALSMTELYLVLAMLPTSFMSNAAAFAVFLYLYLGLSRAQVLEKLTPQILRRYLSIGTLLLLIIFASARWV